MYFLNQKNQEILSNIAKGLKSNNPDSVVESFDSLHAFLYAEKLHDAVKFVFFAINAKHPAIRKAALEALPEYGEEIALPFLLEALHDEDVEVLCSAIEGLGQIGNLGQLPILKEFADDPDVKIRYEALLAISDLNYLGAGPIFEKALMDANQDIQSLAASLLKHHKLFEKTNELRDLHRIKSTKK